MIGISNKAAQAQLEWERKDQAAWHTAADKLIADGYKLKDGNTRRPYFVKPDCEDMILTRQLGALNWTPQTK